MKVLCIGQAVYDITFPCNQHIVENQKYRIYNRQECMGAPAANAAYLCALWGVDTTLMARVGNDLFGKEIIHELEEVNINTQAMYIDPNTPSSISCIITNTTNGNRTILNSPMKDSLYPILLPNEEFNVLLMDGHELSLSLDALNRYSKAKSILDAGTYKPEINELLKRVDYLVCSQDFAYQYTNITMDIKNLDIVNSVFNKLKELNKKTIVITLGEQGVIYKQDDEILHIPAYAVRAVDTTGAGDIFHGAFAYGLAMGNTLEEIIRFASLTSAISVQKIGGKTSIPKLFEVESQFHVK